MLAGAFLFIIFAAYGTGLEGILWCLVLLAAGLVIRALLHGLQARKGEPRLETS